MTKQCPRCGSGLEETVVGAIRVDGCNGCGGVWFDQKELGIIAQSQSSELKALEERFLPSAAAMNPDGDMTCPVCDILLFEFEFKHSPGIKLDACPQCRGIWADDGELQAIYDRIMHSLSQAATARPVSRPMTTHQKARQAVHFLTNSACPKCGEKNPKGCLVCWACATILRSQRDLLCPSCEIPLTPYTFFGKTRLDVCSGCCGVWLDQGELSEVLRRTPEELAPVFQELEKHVCNVQGRLEPGHEYLCPTCSEPMHERQYSYNSGIRVDVCDACAGVWLGTGELRHTVDYYQRQQTAGMSPRST
jgi:uncharacterized protein